MVVESHRVRHRLEDALREGLGDAYDAGPDITRLQWKRLIVPFWFRHADVERVRNLAYAQGGRRFRLDVYRHRDRPSGRPVVLQIHGGGWTISNKDQQGKPLMLHLAARGWVCFAINYPLSPRATWPDHIVAVKRAIAWIREHGPEHGADPSFILVTGGSAGGHLAALAALSCNDPGLQPGFEDADTSVQAAVPYYGVYDFTATDRKILGMLERIVLKRRLADARDVFEAASPIHRCRPDAPPFFVIHGSKDSLVPVAEARAFVERLRATSEAPVAYAELPGAQHAFDVFGSLRAAHVAVAVERFADHAYARWTASAPDSATRLAHG
jgi:acetyl esterase/lipase